MNSVEPVLIALLKETPEGGPTLSQSTEPELESGQVLDGRYRIGEKVGRSGMATIYRAEEIAGGRRTVAIKVPLMRIESDPVCFARFLHEEVVGAKFDHPFLVKVFPSDREKSRPYLVMEFLRGSTLEHMMDRMRPLPEPEALRVAAMACEALAHMHGRGVIHRDLKPANIMICEDGGFRLFDFGLSSAPRRRSSLIAKLTPTFGTPEYMAPEQVENGVIDERSDVYALGAVLYEMLTGEVPFRREDPWASGYARLSEDPMAPRALNPKVSPQAEEIVLRALQRRPRDRFQSVGQLKAALDEPEKFEVTGLASRQRPPARWNLSLQATPLLSGALLGSGVLLALIVAFFLLRVVLSR